MTFRYVVLAEIDCSKIYSNGQAFQVLHAPGRMFRIKLKNTGTLPSDLGGSYTSVQAATVTINDFLSRRESHFDHVKRRREAKV